MCIYVCILLCMSKYIHMCIIGVYTYIYMCNIYIHICTYTYYTCMHTYICVCIRIEIEVQNVHSAHKSRSI